MRTATTEYRESYCWIQGTIKTRRDKFDDMISQKIAGTLNEDDQNLNNEKPKYDFNIEDCLPEKTPKPRTSSPTPMQQYEDQQYNTKSQYRTQSQYLNQTQQSQQQQQKSFGRRSLISKQKKPANRGSRASSKLSQRSDARSSHSNGSSRSNFCNYGNGNTKRLNPKFNLTSYNLGADPGVNPNTLIRTQGRNYALERYGKPFESSVRIYKPGFFESPNQAPEEIRNELEGPFWVTWPQNVPVPDEYAELRPIVALQP